MIFQERNCSYFSNQVVTFFNLMIKDYCWSDVKCLQGRDAEPVVEKQMFAFNNKHFDIVSK